MYLSTRNTKESGKTTRCREMERWSGPTVESTRDSMSIIKDTELEHSTGQTEKNTTEHGKMETNMEEDNYTAVRDIKR